jgi:hypothetical protein
MTACRSEWTSAGMSARYKEVMRHLTHLALTDEALLARVGLLATQTRYGTVELIALLAEIDARKLYRGQGYSSLFSYCCEALHLSEGEAGNRIVAARAARDFPVILDLLRDGAINLTTVRMLAPHLTEENHRATLDAARGKTRGQLEGLVVRLAPRPVPAPSLRRVPGKSATSTQVTRTVTTAAPTEAPAVGGTGAAAGAAGPPVGAPPPPPPPPRLAPLTADAYRLSVTMSVAAREQWQRARELVGGDDTEVLARLLAAALPVLEKRKNGATASPRTAPPLAPGSRHVPAAVKRKVHARDAGRCRFVSASGHRCAERRFLEYHHARPWAAGGETTVENIELRCRAHNAHEARVYFASAHARRDRLPATAEPGGLPATAGHQGSMFGSMLAT